MSFLPVPLKGTVATTDFPSSAGVGALHNYHAVTDAAMTTLLRNAHAVIMGKTNVPEFACSWITANYANGRALNPYDHGLTTGGSSGGSASSVASFIAPIAISEDTGGYYYFIIIIVVIVVIIIIIMIIAYY
jgi:Asp-tRNA(Asn)/Glu-tRNA(Gln) amidotransferase A subunit family amidase